jgi:hypothetical protein
MSDYVTKDDLKAALKETAEWTVQLLVSEMSVRFSEVNQRLDRMEATLVQHGKQLAAGTRVLASFNEWMGKADADYNRVLAELAELRQRVAKLEGGA